MYRPYDWNREERDKAKKNKVNDWYGRGGYQSVIFIPSTPGSVLQQRYQSEVDRQGLRIRAVEKAKVYKEHDTKIGPISDREMRPTIMHGVPNIWERIVW